MSAGHWCVGIQRAGPDPAGVVPVCTILAHAQVEKSSFVDPRQAFCSRNFGTQELWRWPSGMPASRHKPRRRLTRSVSDALRTLSSDIREEVASWGWKLPLLFSGAAWRLWRRSAGKSIVVLEGYTGGHSHCCHHPRYAIPETPQRAGAHRNPGARQQTSPSRTS